MLILGYMLQELKEWEDGESSNARSKFCENQSTGSKFEDTEV
jgi:hypothetical protein